MAKKIVGFVKLQVPAGKANPSPPIGPALTLREQGELIFSLTGRVPPCVPLRLHRAWRRCREGAAPDRVKRLRGSNSRNDTRPRPLPVIASPAGSGRRTGGATARPRAATTISRLTAASAGRSQARRGACGEIGASQKVQIGDAHGRHPMDPQDLDLASQAFPARVAFARAHTHFDTVDHRVRSP